MKPETYLHPEAHQILDQTRTILSPTPYADKINTLTIHVIKGPQPRAFCPNKNHIYLQVPAMQKSGRIEQALDLAGALIENKIVNDHGLPALESLDTDKTIEKQHLNNISIILGVFEIVDTLEHDGHEAIKTIRKMGLGKLYQTWKTGASREECAKLYWNMFNTNRDNT